MTAALLTTAQLEALRTGAIACRTCGRPRAVDCWCAHCDLDDQVAAAQARLAAIAAAPTLPTRCATRPADRLGKKPVSTTGAGGRVGPHLAGRALDLVATVVDAQTRAAGRAADALAGRLEDAAELLRLLAILTRACP